MMRDTGLVVQEIPGLCGGRIDLFEIHPLILEVILAAIARAVFSSEDTVWKYVTIDQDFD